MGLHRLSNGFLNSRLQKAHPLQGEELVAAVEAALRSVNLWAGGIGMQPCGTYSGGMKRRLSVAISLMGSPGVAYLDEPSTVRAGLAKSRCRTKSPKAM